jgi:hypothetical protein
MRTLHHERDGGNGRTFACNMQWCVQVGDIVIYRGPYWRARMIASGSPLSFAEAEQRPCG